MSLLFSASTTSIPSSRIPIKSIVQHRPTKQLRTFPQYSLDTKNNLQPMPASSSSSSSSCSFAHTRSIFLPTLSLNVVVPVHPLTISLPPDFAQTCSPYPSPTPHSHNLVSFRPPVNRPIIISTSPSDNVDGVEDSLPSLRFGTPPSPVLWDPSVPCLTEASHELETEDHESSDWELETARSTRSADLVDRGNAGRECERGRRSSLSGDVTGLGRRIGSLEGRRLFGRIRVEGRVRRWLRRCEEAEEEDDGKK
ncbi:MAG: hypothetical protein Q9171_006789 [Xanthocarpia ochracea]